MREAISFERRTAETKSERARFDRLYDALFPRIYAFTARRVPERSRVECIVEDVFYDLAATIAREPKRDEVLRLAYMLTKRRLRVEQSLRASLKAS
jgi:hypothetical protein